MSAGSTKQTAVIGQPIAHSLSPLLHNAVYKKEGVDANMTAIAGPDIAPLVDMIRSIPLDLVAVTIPHKQTIMPFLDEIDAEAKKIGAVNTIINRDGKLTGYNTDITGVRIALSGIVLEGKNVLLIGAGGVAQTVAYFLKESGAKMFCLNRELDMAERLCARFGGVVVPNKESLNAEMFDVIVNATPLGLKPGDPLPISLDFFRPGVTLFDLIYTPTPLQAGAAEKGAEVISGLSMFVAQGLEQEKLWLGRNILDLGYTALLRVELEKHA